MPSPKRWNASHARSTAPKVAARPRLHLAPEERLVLRGDAQVSELRPRPDRVRRDEPQVSLRQLEDRAGIDERRVAKPIADPERQGTRPDLGDRLGFTHDTDGRGIANANPDLLSRQHPRPAAALGRRRYSPPAQLPSIGDNVSAVGIAPP